MKKALFVAFAALCAISSIMATTTKTGKINSNQQMNRFIQDTIPGRKTDTSTYPKRDTTTMPRMVDQKIK
jgi:hypothetical protein